MPCQRASSFVMEIFGFRLPLGQGDPRQYIRGREKLWEFPDTITYNFGISRNVLPFTQLKKEAKFVWGIVVWEILFFNEEDIKVCLLEGRLFDSF